jgi:hypothetical protein
MNRETTGDSGSPTPDGQDIDARAVQKRAVKPKSDDEVINDDERRRFEWRSRYPSEAWKRITIESVYAIFVFLGSLAMIFLTWRGTLNEWVGCDQCSVETLRRHAYVFASGVLGGSLFGLKYLYKVVARGWWNVDRIVWRLFSPWLAGGVAFGVGALVEAGLFGFAIGPGSSGSSFVSLGFIAGYFADSASRKMQEIADTLFGTHPPKGGAGERSSAE